ncbi:MAG TPA: hypothetical protein VFW29_02800, partial [Solirubrobacteraceae bacterium]|nr:hypothetical protein [Solirubrobacteraceae bacterium]
YTGVSIEALKEIEPSLGDETNAKIVTAESTSTRQYLVESEDTSTNTKFSIERNAEGTISRKCSPEKTGGCPPGGEW